MKKYPILFDYSKRLYEESKRNPKLVFTDDIEANNLVKDLKNYPHAFVLACCMDRQYKSEKCWMIPYRIKEIIGSFDINELGKISQEEYIRIFDEHNLHRLKKDMPIYFHSAVQLILNKYNGDASLIWTDNPSSSTVVCNFLEFKGIGVKIATMATNILAREFNVPMSDMFAIDISPDTHVRRVLSRMGITPDNPSNEQIIYAAKALYPEYPGIYDYSIWKIGRELCLPDKPKCEECIVKSECKYYNEHKM